ncbi:hypothetical protein C8Q73DRAFT_681165 [Cubamyces lactineus]|nr:hypothetical protein C8Q73DRAFT_681165 [Cubamyces lactineus]
MAPYMPPEIVEIVITKSQRNPLNGFLPTQPLFFRNKGCLAACSLVCRSWRPAAQALLFQEVLLTLEHRSPDDFLAFIQSSPHIAGCVRYFTCTVGFLLSLMKEWAGGERLELKELRSEYAISPAVLMEILYTLPAVMHVQFEGFTILGWPRDIPLPTQPVGLKRLTLKSLRYKPFSGPQIFLPHRAPRRRR